jgi:hypothetical protein
MQSCMYLLFVLTFDLLGPVGPILLESLYHSMFNVIVKSTKPAFTDPNKYLVLFLSGCL